MKHTKRKMRSPLKTHGGKSYLARRIVTLMTPHRCYCEPFAGGLSVLLNKESSKREVAGDIDDGLVNFWTQLQKHHEGMTGWLKDANYSRKTWENYTRNNPQNPRTDIGRALTFLIRNRFSRGGLGCDFAWSDRLRGGQPGDVNAWDTIRRELPAIVQRIQKVEFHRSDAIPLILATDWADTLIYCDPPYLHETRTSSSTYTHEMTREQHCVLLEVLRACQGSVILSGYRSRLYDESLKDWERHEFDMPNHSGQGKTKQRRTECLWIKPR